MEKWPLLVRSPWASLPSVALTHGTAALAVKKGQNLPWDPVYVIFRILALTAVFLSWREKRFEPLGQRKRLRYCWAHLVTVHFQGLNTVSLKGNVTNQEWSTWWFQTQWFLFTRVPGGVRLFLLMLLGCFPFHLEICVSYGKEIPLVFSFNLVLPQHQEETKSLV